MKPISQVQLYREGDGRVPVREWLHELRSHDLAAHQRRHARIARLAQLGHELRRPESAYLRDGIHELRIRRGHVNYRILYFFHGRTRVLLAHALTKEDAVPSVDIDRAIRRKRQFLTDPAAHTFELES
jgi:phage-related protein